MSYPFKNFLSFYLGVFFWARIESKLRSGVVSVNAQGACMEIYDFTVKGKEVIKLLYPLENSPRFSFSSFPQPEYLVCTPSK